MKCLICKVEIKSGELVFFGSRMVCNGVGSCDFHYQMASNDLSCVVHLSCLGSSVEVAKTSAMAICGEEAVQRSDALSILGD